MAVREYWEIKWIQWITVQENWTTQVSSADTINIVWWWTVTDVWGVATINIPQWVEWYREDVTSGSATYTLVHSPATDTSFLVFTDSGTLMFLWIDYTYNSSTETITFLTLESNEAAYIWIAHALVNGGNVWDMVKSVYDPTNINSSAFDMDNFIDGTNKHYVSTAEKALIWSAIQPWDNISELVNNAWYITSSALPTKTSDLTNDSGFVTSADIPTKTSDLTNDSGFITSAWDVYWPNSSTNWSIVLFDWATGKLIKDSGLNISVVSTQPSGNECTMYYDNGTIYIQVIAASNILLEDWDNLVTEDWNNLVLEN